MDLISLAQRPLQNLMGKLGTYFKFSFTTASFNHIVRDSQPATKHFFPILICSALRDIFHLCNRTEFLFDVVIASEQEPNRRILWT